MRASCRQCNLIVRKKYIAQNPDRYAAYSRVFRKKNPITAESKEKRRNSEYLRLYALTREQYDAMVIAQDGRCAICKLPPHGPRPSDKILHVDHDHKTGKVRGLLCGIHNRALGAFQDSLELLWEAGIYLANTQEGRVWENL